MSKDKAMTSNQQKGDWLSNWLEKGIVPNRFIWWCYKLQFWRYKEIVKGVLIDKKYLRESK